MERKSSLLGQTQLKFPLNAHKIHQQDRQGSLDFYRINKYM